MKISARSQGPATCPLCLETLSRGGPTQACSGCDVGYHQACLVELGGCGTRGCSQAGRAPTATPPPETPPAATPPAATPPAATPSPSPARLGRSFSAPLLAGVLSALLVGALNFGLRDAPPPSAELAAQAQPGESEEETERFVRALGVLVDLRQLRSHGYNSPKVRELWAGRWAQALQSYEFLTRNASPEDVRAELRRRVLAERQAEERDAAQQLMTELFGEAQVDADLTPIGSPRPSPAKSPPSSLGQ